MTDLSVRTTAGETFTTEDSARLAALIYIRFGRDFGAGASAWRRLLQNSTPDADFMRLVLSGLPHVEGPR